MDEENREVKPNSVDFSRVRMAWESVLAGDANRLDFFIADGEFKATVYAVPNQQELVRIDIKRSKK